MVIWLSAHQKTGRAIKTIEIKMSPIRHLTLMIDDQIAAANSLGIRIVDLKTSRELIHIQFYHADSLLEYLVTLSNNNLACVTADSRLHILNVKDENNISQSFQLDCPYSLLALPNEGLVIGKMQILNAQTGEREKQLDAGHIGSVLQLILLNETKIASRSFKTIKISDLSSGQVLRTIDYDYCDSFALLKNGMLATILQSKVNLLNWESGESISCAEIAGFDISSMFALKKSP
jgi:WD40 repeat protein